MSTICKWCDAIIAACFSECSNCNPNRVNHMAEARKNAAEKPECEDHWADELADDIREEWWDDCDSAACES